MNNIDLSYHSISVKFVNNNPSLDELATARMTIKGSIVELLALADVIGDPLIQAKVVQLETLTHRNTIEHRWDAWDEFTSEIDGVATALHKRVYQLLEEAPRQTETNRTQKRLLTSN